MEPQSSTDREFQEDLSISVNKAKRKTPESSTSTPVLQEFKSGIAQSLELVDSMTEEQKLEAWKTVISLFEEKASIGLKVSSPSSTESKMVRTEQKTLKETTCSPDAIDAGKALLLLTEATEKMEDTSSSQAKSKSSDTVLGEMESTLKEEMSRMAYESPARSNVLKRPNVATTDQSNWKVVILPEKQGITKVKNRQQKEHSDASASGERRSSRLAAKKSVGIDDKSPEDSLNLPESSNITQPTCVPEVTQALLKEKCITNVQAVTEDHEGRLKPNGVGVMAHSQKSNFSGVSAKAAETAVDLESNLELTRDHKEMETFENTEDVTSYVIQVEEISESSSAGIRRETVTVDMEDVRRRVHVQPKDLDHAYHSGDKQSETFTEVYNEDIKEKIEVAHDKRKKQCPICKTFINVTDLKEHQFDHQNICPVCKKETSNLGNLIRHVKEVHDCVRPFPCDKCDKGFFKREYLTKHYKSVHDPSVECPEERYQCDQCEKDFSTLFALNVHKEKHMIEDKLAEPFACEYCGRTFSYKANLKRHERIHTGDKKHACGVCPKKFIERKSLVNHMYKEHDVAIKGYEKLLKKYECGECHKLYSSAAAIQAHMVTHSGLKPNICLQCGQTFGTKTALRRHEDLHAGIKNWECTYCGKRFAEKGSLQTHTRIHTDERPFKCTECDKSFRQRSTLMNHMPVHKPDRNYLCILCGKSFLRRSHYNFHMKKHNTAPSYKCGSCEAAFYRQTDLVRHEVTHTGVKPFQCSICSKKFTRATYLRDHMNVHEGLKPYKCKFCEETFHEMGARSRHMKWSHGQSELQGDVTDSSEDGGDHSGHAVYVQAGTQVIKIITQQTPDEPTQLTDTTNSIVLAHHENHTHGGVDENSQDTETYIIDVQDPEQVSLQVDEPHEVSKIEQLLSAPRDEHELNLALKNDDTFNATELLKLVDIDPDYLANPEEESAQELQIQTEIPQGTPKTFVIYVKPNAVNSKGEPVFDSQ